jgi:hypothetical protein
MDYTEQSTDCLRRKVLPNKNDRRLVERKQDNRRGVSPSQLEKLWGIFWCTFRLSCMDYWGSIYRKVREPFNV